VIAPAGAIVVVDPNAGHPYTLGPDAARVLLRPGALRVVSRTGRGSIQVGTNGLIAGTNTATGKPFYLANYGLTIAAAKRQRIPIRRDWSAYLRHWLRRTR
jgi:hypothetical protein